MILGTVRRVGWTAGVVAQDTQKLSSAQGGSLGSSPLRSFGSRSWWLDRVNGARRRSRESWETALKSQGTYLKTGIVTSGDDEEGRCRHWCWWVENQCVTEPCDSNTVYWGILPQLSRHISRELWGGGCLEIDGSTPHIDSPGWVSALSRTSMLQNTG